MAYTNTGNAVCTYPNVYDKCTQAVSWKLVLYGTYKCMYTYHKIRILTACGYFQ